MQLRTAAALLGALVLVLCVVVTRVDLPALSGGGFWSDGASYHAMARSLAEDLDLRYEARDVFRSRREFAAGPQGIFLKRAHGGLRYAPEAGFPWVARVTADEPRIYFAKSFAYPLFAAPFVALLGTRGLLLTNALGLSLALVLVFDELRRRTTPAVALLAALVLVGGTVAPLYLLWLTPELFNLGVIAAGLWAWRRERPILSALLLGLAIYSKPSNVLLALPLGLAPLLPDPAQPIGRRLLESLRRGLILILTVAAFYGANFAFTGEVNYQGGAERKTFYGHFPLEQHGVTFGNSGIWMTTNQVGPSVEGAQAGTGSRGDEPARPAEEFAQALRHNAYYFWIGRFGGALLYFFPVALALVAFLAVGPRDSAGWLALLTLLASEALYIWLIPDNWYGGSGTLGNRYFLNLLPLAVYLVPRGREMLLAGFGAGGAALLAWPLFLHPMQHALIPGEHTKQAPYKLFPAELSMLNDLSIFGEVRRKKQPYGDTEHDPRAYFLYFFDDGTWFKEERDGRSGFWMRAGQPAEVLLRSLEPTRQIRFRVTGGPAGDDLELRTGAGSQRVTLLAGETRELSLPPGPAFLYKKTCLYTLRLHSTRGAPDDRAPGRSLGAFLELALEIEPPAFGRTE